MASHEPQTFAAPVLKMALSLQTRGWCGTGRSPALSTVHQGLHHRSRRAGVPGSPGAAVSQAHVTHGCGAAFSTDEPQWRHNDGATATEAAQ